MSDADAGLAETRKRQITTRLMQNFAPVQYQLDDESHLHVGHVGAASGGGHFRVTLASSRFEGCSRVARHRLVYDCLQDLMRSDIHALAIVALAPSEITADSGAAEQAIENAAKAPKY
ncbi:MAG: BolA family protein [Pseudomonadota bacterium]